MVRPDRFAEALAEYIRRAQDARDSDSSHDQRLHFFLTFVQEAFGRKRVVVEHRIARLVRLGMRQARYFGRAKTLVQLLLAATVANLTLLAGRVAPAKRREGEEDSPSAPLALRAAANWLIATFSVLFERWWMTARDTGDCCNTAPRPLPVNTNPTKSPAFRAGF